MRTSLISIIFLGLMSCAEISSDTEQEMQDEDVFDEPNDDLEDDTEQPEHDAGAPDLSDDEDDLLEELPPLRAGNVEAGYEYLVNGGYLGCGIPKGAYTISQRGQTVSDNLKLEGRNPINQDLIYEVTAFEDENGVEVVAPNCLSCHATTIQGEVVIGLGNPNRDFSIDPSLALNALSLVVFGDDNRAAFDKYKSRTETTAAHAITPIIGANPADAIAAALISHHDPETLAWSDEPLIALPEDTIPSDVPPLWHVKKKERLYYAGTGQGEHSRMMMIASTMCVDDNETAIEIGDHFVDVEAYLKSLEAPEYPREVNDELLGIGAKLFNNRCAQCHGTYGEDETYPNLVVPLAEIGTDPELLTSDSFFNEPYRSAYAQSYYGVRSGFVDSAGYIAPPLDGVWATAPYFHNGSVPTLELVLNSADRPTYFRRSDNSYDYAPELPGYPYESLDSGHSNISNPLDRKHVYDTTLKGFSNQGHTYGDVLSDEQRAALIEYLKTL